MAWFWTELGKRLIVLAGVFITFMIFASFIFGVMIFLTWGDIGLPPMPVVFAVARFAIFIAAMVAIFGGGGD